MENNSSRRSGLFLLELIVAILFFALASAVCVQIYVGAQVKSRKTSDLDKAVIVCQNAAESLYNSIGLSSDPLQYIADRDESFHSSGIVLSSYFSQDWNPCEKQDAVFTLELNAQHKESIVFGNANIVDLRDNTVLCSLPVTKFV